MKKLNLQALESLMEIPSRQELSTLTGGYDCVSNCLGWFTDSNNSSMWSTFYSHYASTHGMTSEGGLYTSNIADLAAAGGLTVTPLTGSNGIALTSSGMTTNGERVMMTFYGGSVDHAVIVTGVTTVNGVPSINYYDPSTNTLRV